MQIFLRIIDRFPLHLSLRIVHLLLIIVFSIDLQAQFTRDFRQVDIIADGIKSGRVTDFESDPNGYLWITCFDGLLRYDGYSFERFSYDPDNNRSIPNTYVEVLHVDKKGDLWVGTAAGLVRYDPVSNDFERFYTDTIGTPFGFVVNITDGPDSTLWVAVQEGGLYSLDPENKKFIRHLGNGHSASIENEKVRVLLADRDGFIWIGLGFGRQPGDHGLLKYDPIRNAVQRYQHDPNDPYSLVDNRISQLMQDNLDRIFIGTYKNGLHLYDKAKDQFIRMERHHALSTLYPPDIDYQIWGTDPFISILTQDHKGGYWIGTVGAGLHYFSSLTDDPILFSQNSVGKGGLMTNLIWTLHEDPFNIIWVGDLGGAGIHKFDPSTPLFEKIRDPNLYVYKDFDVLDNRTFLVVDREDKLFKFDINTQLPNEEIIVPDFRIHDMYTRDDSDHIWIAGMTDLGESLQPLIVQLFKKDWSTKIYYPDIKISNNEPSTVSIEEMKNKLWVSTGTNQLYSLDPQKNLTTLRVFHFRNNAKIDQIFQSNDGLWISDQTNKTLLKFDENADTFAIELENHNVMSLWAQDSITYLGTVDGMLIRKKRSGEMHKISISEGSSRSEINMLFKDSSGRLWLGTAKGLYMLNNDFNGVRFAGIRGPDFKNRAHLVDNKIYTNTDQGILVFNPDQILGNQVEPIIDISAMDVQGDQVLLSKNNLEELSFRHDENNITFSYVGLHYSDPLQNRYKYRLKPFDNDWIMADNDRSVRYTNIPPGQYQFELMASNSSGIWTSNPKSLSFEIRQPWWYQWWALSLFSILLIFFSLSIYHLLINRKLQYLERKRLLELNEFKTKLYANVTHEFRTPLTVIMGLADNLRSHFQHTDRQHAKSASMIYDNGEHLLHLVNKMLDFSKLQDDSMLLDLTQADIVPLIKNTVQGFHPLAREKDIILQLNDEVSHLEMEFDAQKLAIILSNLISNALKFTPTYGMVKVRIFKQVEDAQQYFNLSVIDNGIGIPPQDIPKIFDRYFQSENHQAHEVKGSGIGLSLTRELVELMNGKIRANQSDIGGMEFTLTLPIALKDRDIVRNVSHSKIIEEDEEVNSNLASILLIEDNYDIAHYISTCLDRKFQILHEADGDRGLETAFEKLPDLVITDLMLPGIQGFEIVKAVKEDPRTDHIPIIILTAKVAMHDRLQGLQLGADAYLTKPFDKEELLIRIERLLEIRQKLQKKYRSHLLSSTIDVDPGSKEDHFILKAEKIILENLQDEDFSGNMLASKMYLSRSQFHRKIKALTGMSASIYIRHVRLQQALSLLKNPEASISEIAYQVGFKSPVYFSQVFREKFNLTPSEMRESISKFS